MDFMRDAPELTGDELEDVDISAPKILLTNIKKIYTLLYVFPSSKCLRLVAHTLKDLLQFVENASQINTSNFRENHITTLLIHSCGIC
ncbi:unnamed protein product [Heterobilharzia americana]|nr:unnamed protein product [Heterobilharzia americana]